MKFVTRTLAALLVFACACSDSGSPSDDVCVNGEDRPCPCDYEEPQICESGQWLPCACDTADGTTDLDVPDTTTVPDTTDDDVSTDALPVDVQDVGPDTEPMDATEPDVDVDGGIVFPVDEPWEPVAPQACDQPELACCSTSGLTEPRGHECRTDLELVQYACSQDANALVRRFGRPGCEGGNVECSARSEFVAWGEWLVVNERCDCVETELGPYCANSPITGTDAACWLSDPEGPNGGHPLPMGTRCREPGDPREPGYQAEFACDGPDPIAVWSGGFCNTQGRCEVNARVQLPLDQVEFSEGTDCFDSPLGVGRTCVTYDGDVNISQRDDIDCAVDPTEFCNEDTACCDQETYRWLPEGTTCGEPLPNRLLCREGQLVRKMYNQFCWRQSANNVRCYTSEDNLSYELVDDCAARGAGCVMPPNPADVDPYCLEGEPDIQCTSGECCDDETGRLLGPETFCGIPERPGLRYCGDDNDVILPYTRARCSGTDARCGVGISTVETRREVESCGDDSVCTIRARQGTCVPTGSVCNVGEPCCNSRGETLPAGSSCGEVVQEWGECNADGSVLRHQARPGCLGTSGTACSSEEDDLVWTEGPWCRAPWECVDNGPQDGRCGPPGAVACSSGECCNTELRTTRAQGDRCQSDGPVRASEFRCAGDELQRRRGYPGCPGGSASCSESPADLAWTEWEFLRNCTGDDVCYSESPGRASCVPAASVCTDGPCCDSGRPQPSGTICGVAYQESTCVGNEIHTRTTQYTCNGLDVTCPNDASLLSAGDFTYERTCSNGCQLDNWERAYCRTATTTDTYPCGNPCLLGGICGAGAICQAGTCVPADCTTCGSSRCDYNAATCRFTSCDDGGPSGGGTTTCVGRQSGDSWTGTLRREAFTVGGVSVTAMDVEFGFRRIFGEPIKQMSWRYWTAGGAQLPVGSTIYLAIRSLTGSTVYVDYAPVLASNGTWGYNTGDSPDWDELYCGGPSAPDTCLDETSAKALWNSGPCITGFVIAP